MSTKFRPITKEEKVKQIGVGLLMAFIFASVVGFLAPFLFQWAGGFFNPTPDAPQDCNVMEFLRNEKSIAEYRTCTTQSNSFEKRLERLSHKIPWFWISFFLLAWTFLKNSLKGRIRDDSDDVTYPGQGVWGFVSTILGTALFYVLIWAFLARDKSSFIALGLVVGLMLSSIVGDYWLLKKYGKPKVEN